ncbi:MAG: sodium/solute symporter, partial [Phycisphaerae bacterium]|nr:sodium/solute symporter [Phycisphaerae bacterium]
MHLAPLDVVFFVLFVAFVIGFAIYKSRKEKDSTDYFLAGRGATWPLIGCSLIAANISTEQFVGMSGQGAGATGLAIASYEWVAAVTLVFVAIFFLPRFLRAGIFTIPEYLEYRYNTAARMIMSFFLLIMFVFVTTVSVVYSGGVTLDTFFGDTPLPILGTISLQKGIWIIGIAAVIYTAFGGLKAVLYADLIQGTALIGGGAVVLMFTLKAMGGWNAAMAEPEIEKRMHMVLSSDHPVMPWTILILGIWIPNFYYWGLNQYITQRTLAAKTLREGQFGIIFAAALKLIIPFIIVVPGIMAPVLFREQLAGSTETAADQAYPLLIRELIGVGWRGFVLAALAGAVISSLASMLNSASTIFTMD